MAAAGSGPEEQLLKRIEMGMKLCRCALEHPPLLEAREHAELAADKLEEAVPVPQVRELYPRVLQLYRMKEAELFREPVNAVLFRIPDYFTFVKRPMSLHNVLDNIVANAYSTKEQVVQDLDAIWEACEKFNGPSHEYTLQARKCGAVWKRLEKELKDSKLVDAATREEFVQMVEQVGDEQLFRDITDCLRQHAPHMLLEGDEMDVDMLTVGMHDRLMRLVEAKTARPASASGMRSPAPGGYAGKLQAKGAKGGKGGKGGR